MARPVTDEEIGLKVLRESPEDPSLTIDIVAIHGIGAHPDDSWCKDVGTEDGPRRVNWLIQEDMLPALAPNSRIMRYGYQSHWFGEDAMRQRTSTVAQRLLSALKRERKEFPRRPLIFIAHCFGGLVVLKALLDARVHEDDWPGIFVSTTGLIFLGTPFRGAEGMSQAEMLVAARSEYHDDDIQPEILRILEPGNEFLQDLVDQFGKTRRNANKTQVVCFYELKSSNVGMIVGGKDRTRFVVSESSGCLDLSDATSKHSLSQTHFNMNKFGSPAEEDFEIVADAVRSIVETAHELVLARNRKESDDEAYSVVFSLSGWSQTEHFVAREEELAQIDQALRPSDGRRTVTLHGLGGIGKTQIAIAYAVRHRADFSAIFWFNIKDRDSVKQSFARAARRIVADRPSSGLGGPDEEKDLEKVVGAVKRWLDQPKNTRWLMIFDNYDNPKLPGVIDPTVVDIHQFLPEAYHGSVIIATRLAAVKLGRQIPIQKLSNLVDGLKILSGSSGRSITTEDEDAVALARELDGLPLALATAGAYLSQVATGLNGYLRHYKASWLRLLQKTPELESYEDRALYTTWQLSLEHIKQRNELSVRLLELWAYFDNQDLWFELLREGHSNGPEWLRQLTEDELEFTAVVRLICDYGLAEADTSSEETYPESLGYSMHGCVHSWTIHVLNKDWDVQVAQLALSCIGSHVPAIDARSSSTLQRRLLRHAARCCGFILKGVADINRMEWALHKLGDLHKDQAKLEMAEQMYDRALLGREKALGLDHTETLRTVNSLGLVYWGQGKLEVAEQTYNRALRGYEKALGSDHIETLSTVNNLGLIYWGQGKLEMAEQMYNRALRGCEKALGPDDTKTLRTVDNLGLLYSNQGKLEMAEQMYNRALQGKEKAHGPNHVETLRTVNNLGTLYWNQGKLEMAEPIYNRALRGYEKALGLDHIETLMTVNNLGMLYWNQGKLEMAEQMYNQSLQGKENALGPDHTRTLSTVNNLGLLYADQGKLEIAEQMYDRALRGREKALGLDHISTLDTVNDLGMLYTEQGKLEIAEQMYDRALRGREIRLGPNHSETLETVYNLGNLFKKKGNIKEAEQMYQRALHGLERALHSEHTTTLRVANSFGELRIEQDRLIEAGQMFERALQGLERALGPEHLYTLKVVSNLGLLAMKQGRLEEAEQRYQQAMEGFERSLGVLQVKTYIPALDTLENIGQLYEFTGYLDKAREINKRALEGVEAVFGRSSQRYSKLTAVIANLDKPVHIEPFGLERYW